MTNQINIYTDGSAIENPGPGGWGVVITDINGDDFEISGGESYSTNNRMEMTAVIEALKYLNEYKVQKCDIKITTDSMLIVKTFTAGWKKKANRDLWKELDTEIFYLITRHNSISWEWIKGHSGHPENERCDTLAQTQAKQYLKTY